MKLTFIAHRFPVLSETFVYEPLQWLRALGVDVAFVTERAGSTTIPIPADIAVRNVADMSGLPTALASLGNAPLRTGQVVQNYVGQRSIRVVKRKALWRALLPELMSADALIVHFGPIGARWLAPAVLARKPMLVYFHGYDVGRVLAQRPDAYDTLFRSRAGLLTNCDFQRRRLIAAGADPSRVAVLPLGVSPEWSEEANDAAERHPRIVTIGRLVSKKGLDITLRAFARMRQAVGEDWEYHIVGDGPLRPALTKLISCEGLSSVVRLRGFLPRDETVRLMRGSSIFVLASRSADDGDTEGTPVSILEAASLGLPVVATDHAGIPETLPSDAARQGFLVKEGDVDALSSALARLVASPTLRRQWGDACRAHVLARHSASAFAAGLLDAVKTMATIPSM